MGISRSGSISGKNGRLPARTGMSNRYDSKAILDRYSRQTSAMARWSHAVVVGLSLAVGMAFGLGGSDLAMGTGAALVAFGLLFLPATFDAVQASRIPPHQRERLLPGLRFSAQRPYAPAALSAVCILSGLLLVMG